MLRHDLNAVVAEIETLPPGEALATMVPYGARAAERALVLSDLQRVVDELRRRGHRPTVTVRRAPTGEIHALELEDDDPPEAA
jgi:hypothetical protein